MTIVPAILYPATAQLFLNILALWALRDAKRDAVRARAVLVIASSGVSSAENTDAVIRARVRERSLTATEARAVFLCLGVEES